MAGVKGMKGGGGARVGAGRKRRDPNAAWLAGEQPKPGPRGVDQVVPKISSVAPVCPKDLPADAAAVWRELAPFAIAEGTLEARTAMAFAWLCRNVVLERKLAIAPLTCAGPDHRGMMARVEAGLARFRVTADGKPVVTGVPEDEWVEFEQPLRAIQGGKS